MGEGLQIALFAGATSIAFVVALFADDRDWRLSVTSTGAMLVFWAVNTATWMIGRFGVASLVSDTLFTALAFLLFLGSGRVWLLVLAALYAADVVIDAALASGRIGYRAMAALEDGIFLIQLAAASWPGWRAIARGRATAPA
jgi:hypothetical protein